MSTKIHPSIQAYKEVCKVLDITPAKKIENITDIDNATTVIVPDCELEWSEIKKLAVAFGNKQPYKTYVYDELYEQYTGRELSGEVVGDSYRIVYIPDAYNVPGDTTEAQKASQSTQHVPSVLEAICFWYALRANSKRIDYDSTFIRHFDLAEKRFGAWTRVPYSYVSNDGQPYLSNSGAQVDGGARLAVGSNLNLSPPTLTSSLEARVKTLEDTFAAMKELL